MWKEVPFLNKNYKDRGYSATFEKEFNERKIPFMSQFDVESYIEGITANLIKGGKIQSNDGKLTINLEDGTIKYFDGITETVVV